MKENFEIERKYLIAYPDEKMLGNCAQRSEIVQTYLKTPGRGQTRRVRKRGRDGVYQYTFTEKLRVSDIRRIENERVITEKEYQQLLQQADPGRKAVHKTRWVLPYKGQNFEIDVYPFWKDRAIMEIELSSEDQPVELPPQIRVLREVTSDGRYTNASLSVTVPTDRL